MTAQPLTWQVYPTFFLFPDALPSSDSIIFGQQTIYYATTLLLTIEKSRWSLKQHMSIELAEELFSVAHWSAEM